MGDNIYNTVIVSTTCVVTGIMEETIEDKIKIRYNEGKEEMKTAIKNKLEGGLTDVVEHCSLETTLLYNEDKLPRPTVIMKYLLRKCIGN